MRHIDISPRHGFVGEIALAMWAIRPDAGIFDIEAHGAGELQHSNFL
jgi:hypothetical protein